MKITPEILRDYHFWLSALFVAFLVAAALSRLRRPKVETFVCSKCGQEEAHSPRTIQARRDGKHRYFCRSCHQAWLRTKPEGFRTQNQQGSLRTKSADFAPQKSGCLSILALVLIVIGAITYMLFNA